jgi:hypothetical protein
VVGVGALVMAPVVVGRTVQARCPAALPAVTLTAVAQPLQTLRPLAQPTAFAAVQQAVPLQPQNPLAQQVGFHIAFVGDFISTGAVLFAREFAIPGALLDDIRSGTPAPVAVSRALQTFAQIELEAGRELVGFAAQYVTFQLNFFANLATMPLAFASSFVAGLHPASSPVAALTAAPRYMKAVPSTNDDAVESVPAVKVSTTTRTATEQPKKPKTAVAADDSVSAATVTATGGPTSTAMTDTDDTAVPAHPRDRARHADQASASEQHNSDDRKKADREGGKKDAKRVTRRKAVATKAIRPDAALAHSPVHR